MLLINASLDLYVLIKVDTLAYMTCMEIILLMHTGEMAQLPQYSRLPRLLMVGPDQDGLIAPSKRFLQSLQ